MAFEDLLKTFESTLDKSKVTIFRLDGHSFSKFTSNFKKPFDYGFTTAMKETTLKAFNYFKFSIGFVGSDEITFCIFPKTNKTGELSDIDFSGRVEKMTTLLSGYVSVIFYKEFSKFYDLNEHYPHFDCRVFQVDSTQDALKNISERITYTLKNSRMMFAQSHFSAKKLHKLSSKQAIELVLEEKGEDFNIIISPDNRVGNVVINEVVEGEKDIDIKGVVKRINYTRNVPKLVNYSPLEVLDITF
jgi:tRNA(His) guanylyltransferase